MTPQERHLIDDLFDRLAALERAPREPEAGLAIARGLERAPNALYALVQTVLVQDEALRRANARIEELEAGAAPSGSFLDSMRETLWGKDGARGSVPSVRLAQASRETHAPVWNTNAPAAPAQPAAPGAGASFLGTAAAAAAGVIGGSLLLNGIRNMMGGPQAFAGPDSFGGDRGETRQPWNNDASGGSLAREAGLNDIGNAAPRGDASRHSLFDDRNGSSSHDQGGGGYDNASDFGSDDFGGGGGDSDSV
jgi:hypothetical protein